MDSSDQLFLSRSYIHNLSHNNSYAPNHNNKKETAYNITQLKKNNRPTTTTPYFVKKDIKLK